MALPCRFPKGSGCDHAGPGRRLHRLLRARLFGGSLSSSAGSTFRTRELADDLNADVGRAFFNLAHIAAIRARVIRNVLLRQFPGMSEPPQVGGENLAQIHAPNQAGCCLLKHRFKPTKFLSIVGVSCRPGKRRPRHATPTETDWPLPCPIMRVFESERLRH